MNNMYGTLLDNLDKMDNFLARHELLKLSQKINNMKRPLTNKEIKVAIKKIYPQRKAQIQMASPLNCTKHIKN